MAFMGYDDTIDYLYGLQKHGIKLGLNNITQLLSSFKNPQNYFLSVHVAGTNGKGSTSAMLASILRAAGLKAGLFTSPHLTSFTERIRINDEQITESEVVSLTEEIREAASQIENFSPTFFEFITAMGFLYLRRKNVDWAVVEAGMGGRLDATNILIPEVSVITSVSYDHKEFLGNTISAIAGEKAGIIKDRVPVVTSSQNPEVLDVVERTAEEKGSDVFVYGRDFSAVVKAEDINGSVFSYYGDKNFEDLRINLPGRHQVLNASLALKAIEIFSRKSSHHALRITHNAIRYGLENIKWHGRLEFISGNPPILIDGAHNPSASVVLADSLRNNFFKTFKGGLILIMGIMAAKDIKGIMEPLLPLASEIILTAPAYERAASPQRLAECASAMGFSNIHIAQTVKDAIEMAKTITNNQSLIPNPLILITGSFYTTGEAKEILGGKGILSRLRE